MHLCRLTCSKCANPNFLCPCQLFNQFKPISDPESESDDFGSETDPKQNDKTDRDSFGFRIKRKW